MKLLLFFLILLIGCASKDQHVNSNCYRLSSGAQLQCLQRKLGLADSLFKELYLEECNLKELGVCDSLYKEEKLLMSSQCIKEFKNINVKSDEQVLLITMQLQLINRRIAEISNEIKR